jgi:hypothetical protein
MGLPTQRSLNGDLDSGLGDGRIRHPNPSWGGARISEQDLDRAWSALHGHAPVQGRQGSVRDGFCY